MPDPRWMGPPELVAATFEAGPGPVSTLANQLVWLTEAVNHELAAGLSAVNTAATSTEWIGLASAASAATVTGLNTGLQTLVGWIIHKIAVTQAATEAYAVAASTVIPSVVCQANRDQWAVLNATNFLGINTPAIVALDVEYFGEHYPHNSAIGWTYSAALTALAGALAVPPPLAPPGASPAAPAAAGLAAGQAAGQAAGGAAVSGPVGPAAMTGSGVGDGTGGVGELLGQAPQLFSAAIQPAQQAMELPARLAQGALSPAQSLIGSLGSLGGGMFPGAAGSVLPGAAGPGASTATEAGLADAGAGSWRAGTGPGTATGGYPLGLTRYTRPASGFAADNAGRPVGLPAGMLSAAGRGGVGSPASVTTLPGGAPVSPMVAARPRSGPGEAPGDPSAATDTPGRARVVVDDDRYE